MLPGMVYYPTSIQQKAYKDLIYPADSNPVTLRLCIAFQYTHYITREDVKKVCELRHLLMISFSRHKIFILLGDFFIAIFAFGLLYSLGILSYWYNWVASAVLWVILGFVSQKLQFHSYKRIRYAVVSIFLQTVLTGILFLMIYQFLIPGWKYHYSIIIVLLIILFLELYLYSIVRRFVYRKIPYFYEEPVLDDVEEKGVNPLEDKKKACLNKDVKRIISLIHEMSKKRENVINKIIESKDFFSEDTIFINSSNPEEVLRFKLNTHTHLVIHLCSLNRVRHINTLLSYANYSMPKGGCVVCHCETSALHREKMLRQSPVVINKILYGIDFFWHRVCSKLSFTHGLYFWATGGKSRVLTRVEVLGRMYRAGFDVIHEEVCNGRFYVVATKIKDPIRDDNPSNGLLIRLCRYGKDGKIIGVYKFRTMYSYSEYLQPYVFKQQGLALGGKIFEDYRVSPLGKFLRKMWLDELPMLINWIKGDLKIVGVRPLSSYYFNLYDDELKELRIKTKPGLIPPFYADMPKTFEEIQESERRYLKAYLKEPFLTDWRYFWKVVCNIVVKGKRSQ